LKSDGRSWGASISLWNITGIGKAAKSSLGRSFFGTAKPIVEIEEARHLTMKKNLFNTWKKGLKNYNKLIESGSIP